MLGVPRRFLHLSIRTMLLFMANPQFLYAILFRAVKGAILVILSKSIGPFILKHLQINNPGDPKFFVSLFGLREGPTMCGFEWK